MNLFPSSEINLLLSAATLQQLNTYLGLEIALLGRSNSGKSTFINALCGKKIAFTSNKPGKTRLMNLFKIQPKKELYLMDLPGYGYASVSKKMKNEWHAIINEYLKKRKNLIAVCITIDSRRGIGPLDIPVLEWCCTRELPAHVVLTKTDQLNNDQKHRVLQATQKQLNQLNGTFSVQLLSTLKKIGMEEARKNITYLFKKHTEKNVLK